MVGFGIPGNTALGMAITIFVIVLVVIAFLRWGLDSLNWSISGKKQFISDEEKFRSSTKDRKVTHPVMEPVGQVSERDTFIEDLIAEGRYREARTHIREMKQVAHEMKNFPAVRNYEAYERKITETEIQNRGVRA